MTKRLRFAALLFVLSALTLPVRDARAAGDVQSCVAECIDIYVEMLNGCSNNQMCMSWVGEWVWNCERGCAPPEQD